MIRLSHKENEDLIKKGIALAQSWRDDWNKFAFEVFNSRMDREQRKIIDAVQHEKRVSVASGTARGKDYVTGVAVMCFMYQTPVWDSKGVLVHDTKVALTAPTDRQIKNIMKPEFVRHWLAAKRNGVDLPGRLVANDIRTDEENWFLTGFKADSHSTEAWTGFHAENTMFAVTEASGMPDLVFEAIEGNLQNNSCILLVFNPNQTIGYAAKSQKSQFWTKFRLNSMDAPNIVARAKIIPGQVNVEWLEERIQLWCEPIRPDEVLESEDDFQYMGQWYRPEDIFRIKILGKFPKVSEDSLIPEQWILAAQARWLEYHGGNAEQMLYKERLRLGVDVAGMGRDSSVLCYKYGNIVNRFYKINSGGVANHMQIAGKIVNEFNLHPKSIAIIDTIGEGAGVWSRLQEIEAEEQNEYLRGRSFSCKYSNKAIDIYERPLKDLTDIYEFENKRAYLFWAVRDWLNPKNNSGAMLPPGDELIEEATEIKYFFKSNGKIMIEPKEDIKKRLGKSTDLFDSLANTFDDCYFPDNIDLSHLF